MIVLAVLRKELASLWTSAVPWAAGAALQAVLGVLFVDQLQGRAQAVVQPLFPIAGLLLVVTVPVLAMRSYADEARTSNLDVLRAVRVPPMPVAAGKWLAAWLTACALTAPALVLAGLTALWGDPDVGPIVSGFAGVALLCALVAAVGVLVSAMTTSQSLAALITILVGLASWFVGATSGESTLARTLGAVSLSERLRTFASGGIDVADVAFFFGVTALAVAVAAARHRRTPAATAVLALAVASLALSGRHDVVDLTAQETLTLSPITLDVLAAVDDDLTITAFVGRTDPGRVEAVTLLDRYEREAGAIDVDVVDPDVAPGEARRFGIDPVLGGVVVQRGRDVEVAAAPTEQDVTSAIARLVRGNDAVICLATGHGELDLVLPTYDVRVIDLLVEESVPSHCTVVVLAAPQADLGAAAARALAEWIDGGGKLLALLDPTFDVRLDGVLAPYGIAVARGVVFEGDPAAVVNGDETSPVVRRYSAAHPVVRNLAPTYFPGVQGIVIDDGAVDDVAGLTVSRLADTSELSYLETQPLEPSFDPTVDTGGPVTVAVAADRSRVVSEEEIERSRLVIVGDVDFATTAVDAAANQRFLLQAIGWLTMDDQLIPLSSHLPIERPLVLTDARVTYARLLGAVGIPSLLLVGGALVWAARRRR